MIHPLATWIDARMPRSEFAKKAGMSEPHLSQVLQRKRGLSLDVAVRIEAATDGEFTAARLHEEQKETPVDEAAE